MEHNNEKILIEIAAYRDPQLLYTVHSALIQADNPERVSFSICYQSDNLEDLEELQKIKNCRIKYLKESEARGSCYARYLCQQMIEDEDYIYQIDSHMRFIKHWDTKMIELLLSINDKKASISFYPPNCTKDMMKLPLNDPIFDKPTSGGTMYIIGFVENESHFTSSNCIPDVIDENTEVIFKQNPLISAGNFFSFADIHREVIHDPNMYFYGDELPMALRYYTYGWNNYCCNYSYIYHEYDRLDRKWPSRPPGYHCEDQRFNELLDLDHKKYDMGKYGLGRVRTIKDFEDYVGLDFSKRIVYMSAERGIFDDPKLKKQISYVKDRRYKEEQIINKKENVTVIILDPDGEYEKCLKSSLEKATYKENISFLIATTNTNQVSTEELNKNHIKQIIHIKDNFSYCKELSKLTEFLDDCYVAIVDSAVVFLSGWDKYNCTEIKKCGSNVAFTDWVWYNSNTGNDTPPYFNLAKTFDRFECGKPILKYDEENKFSERKTPYKNPWISDGFLFCHSRVLKKVKVDPNLSYDEHNYMYSVRLWTNGIDLYYPITSFFYRTKDQSYLNSGENNYGVINALVGYNTFESKKIKPGYKYKPGKERPLWRWYEEIGFDYTKDKAYEIYK